MRGFHVCDAVSFDKVGAKQQPPGVLSTPTEERRFSSFGDHQTCPSGLKPVHFRAPSPQDRPGVLRWSLGICMFNILLRDCKADGQVTMLGNYWPGVLLLKAWSVDLPPISIP